MTTDASPHSPLKPDDQAAELLHLRAWAKEMNRLLDDIIRKRGLPLAHEHRVKRLMKQLEEL